MAVTGVIALSIGLRLLATALALRLIRITGQWRAWSLLAAAFLLMAARQTITLYRAATQPPDVEVALLGFAISVLMVVAVPWAGGLLLSMRRSQEALQETRDDLSNLIDCANTPIIVWDPGFRVIWFNRAFEHLTGRRADEVVGGPLGILFPDKEREESMALIRRTAVARGR